MKTHEEIITELDSKIPRDVIAERQGGGSRKLSYLEGWYVIDRLNKTLGQGNWGYTLDLRTIYEQEVDGYWQAAYTAIVRLWAKFPNSEKWGNAEFEDVGYGDGKDRHRGKAHESATKEAVTDAIKRCAKNLGMSMGLALYDKSQENVSDDEEQPANAAPDSGGTRQNAPRGRPSTKAPADRPAAQGPKPEASVGKAPEATQTGATREQTLALISSMSKVIVAQKKSTVAELVTGMKVKFGVEKKEDLTDAQANELHDYLKGILYG